MHVAFTIFFLLDRSPAKCDPRVNVAKREMHLIGASMAALSLMVRFICSNLVQLFKHDEFIKGIEEKPSV